MILENSDINEDKLTKKTQNHRKTQNWKSFERRDTSVGTCSRMEERSETDTAWQITEYSTLGLEANHAHFLVLALLYIKRFLGVPKISLCSGRLTTYESRS